MIPDMRPRLGDPATGVIITGGASGIGLASARALAAVGRPVALWDLNVEAAKAGAAEIASAYGVPTLGVGLDLRDASAIPPALDATRKALPTLGGLAYCAGTARSTGIEGVNIDEWNAGLALHVGGLMLLVQALLPDFKANPGSAVVAMGSINGHLGAGGIPIYSAAKGAVPSLIRSLADELGRDGIRANTVAPGLIDTPMAQGVKQGEAGGAMLRRILLGRLGAPEEIGRLVRFLLSEEASYITAAEIFADGGNVSSQRG